MAGRREQKKQAVWQRLYDAAIAAFERDGYEQASVDAICADAGVAKGTFFNHFPSKADVLAAWYEAQLAQSFVDTGAAADPWQGPALALVELVRQQPALWAAKQRLSTSSAALARIDVAGDERLRAHYARLLQQAGQSESAARQAAELVVATLTGSCREWCIADMAGQADEALEPLLRRRLIALRQCLRG